MKSLRETERRNPERLVIAAFLWAPTILIAAVLTKNPEIIIPALFVAGAPFTLALLWPFYVSIRETQGRQRAGIIAGTLAFFALALVLSWLGFPAG